MKKDINMQFTEEKISVIQEDEKPSVSLVIRRYRFFLSTEMLF